MAFVTAAITDFTKAEHSAIEQEIEKSGGSMTVFNSNFDPQKLQAQCADAVNSKRYNVIVVSVFEPPTGVPCATVASAAGIPVIAADTAIGTDPNDLEPQVEGVKGGVYITPEANAAGVVELAKSACEGLDPCEIIGEVVTPTDQVTNYVLDAVAEQVPNAKIVQKIVTGFDPSVMAQKMPDVLSANPGVDVLVAGADSEALAALPAIKQSGMLGKLKILGNGGSRLGAKAVADGTLFGSTGSWPEQEGRLMYEMARKAVNDEPIEPVGVDALKMDTPQILTKENVAEFTPEWGASR